MGPCQPGKRSCFHLVAAMPQVSDRATRMPDSCSLRRRIKSAFRGRHRRTNHIGGFGCVSGDRQADRASTQLAQGGLYVSCQLWVGLGARLFAMRSQPVGQPLAIEQIAARAFGGGRAKKGSCGASFPVFVYFPARTPFPIGVKAVGVVRTRHPTKALPGPQSKPSGGLAGPGY